MAWRHPYATSTREQNTLGCGEKRSKVPVDNILTARVASEEPPMTEVVVVEEAATPQRSDERVSGGLRVDAHVAVEVTGLAEAEETQLALVGLLPGVDPQVLRQRGGVAEGLFAHPTTVGSLAGVCAHVRGDGGGLRELAVADGTSEGLLPTVGPDVGREVGRLTERLVAVVTPEEETVFKPEEDSHYS